jgi:hypothetical protein
MSFTITHAFHPQRGARFALVTRHQCWGEDRLMYFDGQGRLRSIIPSWTSVGDEEDLFLQASAGRSWFRPYELLHLAAVLEELRTRSRP